MLAKPFLGAVVLGFESFQSGTDGVSFALHRHVIRKLLRSRHFVPVTTPAVTKFVGQQIPTLSAMACVPTSSHLHLAPNSQ
jgi:hypothetical protein